MAQPDYVRWLRSHVGHQRVILPYTSAILSDGHGQVLLQRRSDFGWWGLPGGVLERGESLEDCVRREVLEETGLQVVPQRLVGLYSSPDFNVIYPNGDQIQQFSVCFACQVAGGALQADGVETLDLGYFSTDRLPEIPPWYRAMIEDFRGNRVEASYQRGQAGRPTSQEYTRWLRQFVGHEPIILIGGGAYVLDEEERVLLVHRADTGTWGIPAGGMELGERIDTAIEREVREETGLEVKAERLIGTYAGPEFFITYPNGDQAHLLVSTFATRIVGGRLRPDGRETLAVRFFPLDQLPPIRPLHKIRIQQALAGQRAAAWR